MLSLFFRTESRRGRGKGIQDENQAFAGVVGKMEERKMEERKMGERKMEERKMDRLDGIFAMWM